MKNTLCIIVPCYNEEEIFESSNNIIVNKLNELIENKKVSIDSKIIYVNDGSKDNTLQIMKKISSENECVKYISLSKNYGQQRAILAGIKTVKDKADMILTIDMDLQDDINKLEDFINEYYKGIDIVFGVRNSRKTDSFFKRNTALLYYKIMKFLGADIVYNHSEYRLMSKKAIEALCKYNEKNIFLRGIVKDLGFKTSIVYYERKSRKKGKSKYNLKKMFNLAKEGILSFTTVPLKLITTTGMIVFLASIVYCIYALIGYFNGTNVIGWTTIVGLICLFGGFQILCIGVIGEYIAKIYFETKNRPTYLIDETNV